MIFKIPTMGKEEYDSLVKDSYVSRIAFLGDKYPYIAPFLYVFDGKYMYFLSTKYGRKVELLKNSPYVSVEIENFSKDMSYYRFITLQGKIVHEEDFEKKTEVKKKFLEMISSKNLSNSVLEALGQNSDDPIDSLLTSNNTHIWKLTEVEDIVALKNEK